jgi:hypothetical protein
MPYKGSPGTCLQAPLKIYRLGCHILGVGVIKESGKCLTEQTNQTANLQYQQLMEGRVCHLRSQETKRAWILCLIRRSLHKD